jgi:hypothetical protein
VSGCSSFLPYGQRGNCSAFRLGPVREQVVDPKPGFKRVVNNFSGKDYQTIGLATLVSMPFGYFAGAAAHPLLDPLCQPSAARQVRLRRRSC